MKRFPLIAMLFGLLWTAGAAQPWTLVSTGTSSRIYNLFFASPDTGWIVGESALIRKTTDGGATWTAQSGDRNLTSASFLNTQMGWAVGGSGGVGIILKTTNGGTNWVSQGSSLNVQWNVTFLNPNRGWSVGAGGQILSTTNGGTTWSNQSSGTTNTLISVNFIDSLTGWVSGAGGVILHTVNGGVTWTPQATGSTSDWSEVEFSSPTRGWAVGSYGAIVQTTNGGTTWSAYVTGATTNYTDITFLDSLNGYIVGFSGTILKTTDGGVNWIPQSSGVTGTLNFIQSLKNGTFWICGDVGVVLKSASPLPPSGLAYAANPVLFGVGISGTDALSFYATPPLTFIVTPALPNGLSLNPINGTIGGTASAVKAPADYLVRVSNAYGSDSTVLRLSVIQPPTVLSYSTNPANYPIHVPIQPNIPSVTGSVTVYSVNFPLPAGLTLDPLSGVISGTPTVSAAQDYTITASNGPFSTSAPLQLIVPAGIRSSANRETLRFQVAGALLSFAAPAGAHIAKLEVLQAGGQIPWKGTARADGNVNWNGTGAKGLPLPAGAYVLRVTWQDATQQTVGSSARRFTLFSPL